MEEFGFASKEEDIVYFFQGVTDNGYIANIDTNPKKGLLGGVNNVLIISIFEENDENGNYWEWSDSTDNGTFRCPNVIVKALNPIDQNIYTSIMESYDRLKDIIDFKKYDVQISIYTRFLHQMLSENGRPIGSMSKNLLVKRYNNIMPVKLPAASRSHDLNVCCGVEFHVKPKKEDGKIVKSFKNFFK